MTDILSRKVNVAERWIAVRKAPVCLAEMALKTVSLAPVKHWILIAD